MLSINPADVLNILSLLKGHLIAIAVVLVLAIAASVIAMRFGKALKKLIRAESWIAALIAIVIVINLIITGPLHSLIELASQKGEISESSIAAAQELCEDIADEGIVLVKNEGNTLPLAEGKKVNVFGWSATNPVYGGTGSGSISMNYPLVSLLEGLSNAGIEYNKEITDFYSNWRSSRPMVGMFGQDWTIPEPTISEYNGLIEKAKSYSDTAILVIARSGGEGADLPTSYDAPDSFVEGGMFGASGLRMSSQLDDLDAAKHYLELSNREIALLNEVTKNYNNVIVVINAANAMELGFVNKYPQIKSVLICPGAGQTGFNALGSILSGKVNPSAKTVDTYVYDLFDTPTANNFGYFHYTNMDEYTVLNAWGMPGGVPNFVNYVEGIFVGYRFWETAAAEGVINYNEKVVYPFGYGLSYTTFKQELNGVDVDSKGNVTVDVKVTNTGSVAGKEVVQVYFNPPYTNGGIEKASANLVGFEKTDIIKPGSSERVKVTFKLEDMASYDTYGNGCYVLEAGDYIVSINSDSHNIIASEKINVATTVVYDENNARSTDKNAAINTFSDSEGKVTYLSRANHFANYKQATAAPTDFVLSDNYKSRFESQANYDYKKYNNSSDVMPVTGKNNGLSLIDLKGLSYDDPKWEDLLDQITLDDMKELIAMGGYKTAEAKSIDKIMTSDCDGPASINNNFTGMSSIGFPAGVMIAATWNKDLAHDFGASIGQMADEMNVSGWYAPAMNTHRSAFAGRNFEYYSEDGILSGWIASQAVKGAAEQGVYSYIKHFALNDQETNRTDLLCTWANEQSIREIYLKPFEMCVKQGGAMACMTAFNYIGIEPAEAHKGLLIDVLRGEWGFMGFTLTDYYGGYCFQDADRMVRGGTDCMLATADVDGKASPYVEDTSATSVKAMRESVHHILYTVVNSRAYNTAADRATATYMIILITTDIITVLLAAVLEFLSIRKYIRRRSENGVQVTTE